MKPSQVLRAARDKLAPPECWIQFDYARTARNQVTDPRECDAICWCSNGAIIAVTWRNDDQLRTDARRYLRRTIERTGYGPRRASDAGEIIAWNDAAGRVHEEVLAAFAKAAELAERDGQ